MAKSANAVDNVQRVADAGFTKPADVERMVSAVTGDTGKVTKLTRKLVETAKPVNTFDGVNELIDQQIAMSGLTDADAKAVRTMIEAQLNSLPSRREGSVTYDDNAADVFKVVKNLEKRSANLKGKSGTNYSTTTPERVDKARVVDSITAELKNRIYNNAAPMETILTPDVAAELKSYAPKNEKWADYVDNDSLSDKFYLTGDFAKVDIARDADGKHIIGNNEYRDAFNGHVDVEVLPVYETDVPPVEGHIEMKRPLAKFEFITDDLDEFVARVLEKKALEAQASGEVLPEEALKPSSVDLNEFRIVIRHMGFMPDLFSLLDHTGGVEGNPIYSTPSVSFESRIQRINQTEASLGFDYVFVNNNESKLKLSVSVYNKNNTLLSSVPDVVIPIKRSKLTTIRGSFMTQSAQGGVGIEPGFEGDIIFPVN
jgi:hypothetical protein